MAAFSVDKLRIPVISLKNVQNLELCTLLISNAMLLSLMTRAILTIKSG